MWSNLLRSSRNFWRKVILEGYAVFHHEDYLLDRVDVLCRVTINRDNIRELTCFDRADAIRPVQQLSAIDCCGL